MKRREVFKNLGILAIVGGSSFSLLSSCTNDSEKAPAKNQKEEKEEKIEQKPINGWTKDRSKLIVNRNHQKIADLENPTKLELKHTPDITFGEKDEKGNTLLKVTIGKNGIIHPSTKEHWIDYLRIFVNGKQIAYTEYVNGDIRAYANYFVVLKSGDKVKVEAGCNLHGIWTNEVVFE